MSRRDNKLSRLNLYQLNNGVCHAGVLKPRDNELPGEIDRCETTRESDVILVAVILINEDHNSLLLNTAQDNPRLGNLYSSPVIASLV
jgi:hypothetical protein